MAISPIGNITYINQNTQANVANIRHEEATPFINQEFQDKLKEIEEVRPTEETNTINKDSENKQNQDFYQEEKDENKKEEEIEKTSSFVSDHLLDIKA